MEELATRATRAMVEDVGLLCPACGTEVTGFEDSVTGVEHVCPVCLIDLQLPDPQPSAHHARARHRRTRVAHHH